MRGTLALLRLRLRQAVAGRLPWLALVHLGLVGGLVLLAPAPTPADRLRLVLGASVALAGLVAAIGGIAFGASLLPEDRETRRIHRVLALPVGRGGLAASTVGAAALVAAGLAVSLSLLALPLVPLAGDAAAREEVLASTVRLRASSLQVAGVRRELDDRVWLFPGNLGVRWEVDIDPADLGPGDVHGRIEIARRLDRNAAIVDTVPLGVRVEGHEETLVHVGPDRPVPVVVPEETARQGTVRIVLRWPHEHSPAYVIGVTKDSLRLDGRRRSFLPEYGLAALGAGLVAALLAALAAALSAVASAGVATAAALCVGLVASLRGFLVEAATNLRLGIGHHHGPTPEPGALDRFASSVVEAVAALSPDLAALGMAGPLREGTAAGASTVGAGLPDLAIVLGLSVALAMLLLRLREDP